LTLSFIGKGRVSWRDVLFYVVTNEGITSRDVSEHLDIKHPDACIRLRRLKEWGMVRALGGQRNRTFEATGYGKRVALNPETKTLSGMKGHYKNLNALTSLIDGPVSLMRVVEIEDIKEVTKRIGKSKISVEKKYDGWLAQIASGGIYSRRGMDLSDKFAPISELTSVFTEEHVIGELVYRTEEGKMNEGRVTSVAGTKSAREAAAKLEALEANGGFFQIVLFDIIAHRGTDISRRSFEERREILEGIVPSVDEDASRLTLSPTYSFKKWPAVYQAALNEGGEGVVIKNLDAPYFWAPLGEREPKRQGTQWKLKVSRSDDFVVVSGHVSQKGSLIVTFGQFHQGEFIKVGDVNNFSAATEKDIIKRLKKGPFVMEIAFQERFNKPPGKLRSPRFVRFRDDKPIESATLPPQFAPTS
jgi:ATP-dependent DNA ligase